MSTIYFDIRKRKMFYFSLDQSSGCNGMKFPNNQAMAKVVLRVTGKIVHTIFVSIHPSLRLKVQDSRIDTKRISVDLYYRTIISFYCCIINFDVTPLA